MPSQARTNLSISAATLGNNTLLVATTGSAIRVLSVTLVAAGAVTVQFQSGAGGAALTGVMSLVTGTPLVVPLQCEGLFQTAASALLNLSLGGAVQVSGFLTYALV